MYGRGPLPSWKWLTILLLALWALLAIYVVWTGNTLGYIILALFALFVFLPALVVWLGARVSGIEMDEGTAREEPPLDGDTEPDGEPWDTADRGD